LCRYARGFCRLRLAAWFPILKVSMHEMGAFWLRVATALYGVGALNVSSPNGFSQNRSRDPYILGVTLRSHDGCPTVVWTVLPKSPAEAAGIAVGDALLEVEGIDTRTMAAAPASKLLRSENEGSVVVKLSHHGTEYTANVRRDTLPSILARTGKKIIDGFVVSFDTTEAEVKEIASIDGSRISVRVFPSHYPADLDRYYGGFEIFVSHDPNELIVGGIEDGPGARAGIHSGNRILAVDGVDPTGKDSAELEQLFSSTRPKRLHLKIARAGEVRNVEFTTQRAFDLLKQNGQRMVNGEIVPIGLSADDARCLTQPK
jgi:C-terminal processing protease CtpA/Prc